MRVEALVVSFAVEEVRSERKLALGYSLVACIGFAIDASLLIGIEHLSVEPAWARVISLTLAMQATFWINGLFIFRCLTRQSWIGAWTGYMVTSGFGNFCNYWTFVTLVSLHDHTLSNRLLDLVIGGVVAWSINYLCARFLIFGVSKNGTREGCTPIGEVAGNISARFRALTHRAQ
jgi:putative flippase GtrA